MNIGWITLHVFIKGGKAMEETPMKVEKAFTIIGKKLEKEYKKFGFKYLKKSKLLKKTTKKYDYLIFFSSFFEYVPNTLLELHVVLLVNEKMSLKNNAIKEVFRFHLWEAGNHYNIINELLIKQAFLDLREKINKFLIPYIKKLEEGKP